MDEGSPPQDVGFAPTSKKRTSEANGNAEADDTAEAESSHGHGSARRRRDLVKISLFAVNSVTGACTF